MTEQTPNQFEQRFRSVVAKMRLTRVLTVLGWITLCLTIGLIVLACVDYLFETNWNFRAAIVGVAMLAAVSGASALVLRVLQRWNRRSTAAAVEQRFEDLGQSIRTTVQFRDQESADSGVSQNLLSALNEDVYRRTEELRLSEAVSTGPLKLSLVLLVLLALITTAACWRSWDWRMAASRTLLGNQPYTTVQVEQGDVRIDEKATFTLNTNIAGRTNRDVSLRTRDLEADDSDWSTRALTSKHATATETRLVSYTVDIAKVKQPFEYQVVAGKYASPVHRVDVRYPLAITEFNMEVTPPEYTGIETKMVKKGSFDIVEGSLVTVGLQLDHAPAKAWLSLRPIVTPLGEEPQTEIVPLEIDGTELSADLALESDRLYQIFAETEDGTQLRPNKFRIRVLEDRAPRLAFQKPDQLIEVHPLAELLMRLKVSDDYGLRRVGIVFQLNNDAEIPLEDIPYEDLETESGRLTPQTKALIESFFPLEYFDLTVRDSISYYGFAEDNRPDQANTNETDLQFIDVRPFRREYSVPEDGQGLNGMGNNNPNRRNLPGLNEMIGRERFVLNRTLQMKRQDGRGKRIDANALDNLISIQNESSGLAGEMGDAAVEVEEEFGIPEGGRISELLYQAQDSMLLSVDALAGADFEVAKLQEKDALQFLITARQRIDQPQSGRNAGGAAFRAAFRRLMRRNRGPRTNQERAREVVRRLRKAAAEQEFLMEKMSDLIPPETPQMEAQEGDEAEDEPEDAESEQDDSEAMEDEATEAEELEELQRELEQEQADLAEEIEDIVDMIEELTQVSELAGQRTQVASNRITGILGALERGDARSAMQSAQSSSAALRVLAENIAGTTADEATKRIEIARDLGMFLTDEIRDLDAEIGRQQQRLDEDDLDSEAAAELESELADALSQRAQEQADVARTIEDILNSILDPLQGIQDQEDLMVKRLQEIIDENKLVESVARMQALPDVINSTDWSNASIQSADLADRFEIVSQRLDAMHREILSPRVEQLRKLEKRAAQVRQQLRTELQTDGQVDRWHLRTDGLLEDIESAKVAESQVTAMQEAMAAAGWGVAGDGVGSWNAKSDGSGLQPPAQYGQGMEAIVAEIQRYIRELSMVDSEVINTGAVPAKYRQLVERYMDVLSGATDPVQDDATFEE